MKKVQHIEFRMKVDGKTRVLIFIRPEKIDELLSARESLGAWLRAMRDTEVTS